MLIYMVGLILKQYCFRSFFFLMFPNCFTKMATNYNLIKSQLYEVFTKEQNMQKDRARSFWGTLCQVGARVNIVLSPICMKTFIFKTIAGIYFHYGTICPISSL